MLETGLCYLNGAQDHAAVFQLPLRGMSSPRLSHRHCSLSALRSAFPFSQAWDVCGERTDVRLTHRQAVITDASSPTRLATRFTGQRQKRVRILIFRVPRFGARADVHVELTYSELMEGRLREPVDRGHVTA